MKIREETSRGIRRDLIVIIILAICLILSTFTLAYATSLDDTYKINLNDGLPIVDEYTQKIRPGTVIEREFFIENKSSSSLNYSLYFMNVDGKLGDEIIATFYDGDEEILSGKMNEITKKNIKNVSFSLGPKERKNLKVVFTFPKEMSNDFKNSTLTFDVGAIAVWPK